MKSNAYILYMISTFVIYHVKTEFIGDVDFRFYISTFIGYFLFNKLYELDIVIYGLLICGIFVIFMACFIENKITYITYNNNQNIKKLTLLFFIGKLIGALFILGDAIN